MMALPFTLNRSLETELTELINDIPHKGSPLVQTCVREFLKTHLKKGYSHVRVDTHMDGSLLYIQIEVFGTDNAPWTEEMTLLI